MFSSKCIFSIFVLCLVHVSLSKPYSNNIFEGRGVGSTLWGWITYPFSWWSTDVGEIPFETDSGLEVNRFDTYNTVEVGRYNVTLWCNDQTCTTVKCDKFGCLNITCNMYDTDITGECRSFNTKVKAEEPTTQKPSETESKPKPTSRDQVTESTPKPTVATTKKATIISSTAKDNIPDNEDRPLELEAVLSSTVTEKQKADV